MLSLQKFITGFLLPNFRFFVLVICQMGRALRQKERRGFSLVRGGNICCSVSPLCLIFVPWCDKALNLHFSVINIAIRWSLTPADYTDIANVLVLWFLSYPCSWCEALWFSPCNLISSLFCFCISKSFFSFSVILQKLHKLVVQTCPLLLLLLAISELFFEPAIASWLCNLPALSFSQVASSPLHWQPIVFIFEGFSQVLLCAFVLIPWQCWHIA